MQNGSSPRELSFRAILLGSILAVVLAAANAYLGLYAGLTVSASIPAAVLSMAILRGLLKGGTIWENNVVQTIAASGETMAAGVIFTVPALMITQSWHHFHYWPTTLIAMTGTLLGILFMIPLRRALIVEEKELIYPEGVACAEVLKAGDKGGHGARTLAITVLLGGLFKFLSAGTSLLKGGIETAWQWGGSLFYVGTEGSLALISVGYIVGLNVAVLQFIGGVIAWVIAIPLYTYGAGIPEGELVDAAWSVWKSQIRYIGVGAMAVGGVWTIYSVREGIRKGVKKVFGKSPAKEMVERTDQDLKRRVMLPVLLVTLVGIFFLYRHLTGSAGIGFFAMVLMVIAAFVFVAVASYMVGLVGSSNLPVSGMTIASLMFAALFLHLVGINGSLGVLAVLGIAGVVCCAASSAGDISQDLKTGHLIGSTPWKLQVGEFFGAVVPAFFLAPVLTLLQKAYGIGTPVREGIKPLVAPQATLFAKLAETFFLGKGTLPLTMVVIGMVLAVATIIADQILKSRRSSFRAYVMAVAIGIYLPLQLSAAIFIGGMIRKFVTGNGGETSRGILVASGLIAGEAIMGVIVAGLIVAGLGIPLKTWAPSNLVAVICFIVYLGLFTLAVREKKA